MRSRRTRAGSVLMELVMVIPLLVTLITGTLWIGDLILVRQRLVIADRYVAWNLGNRHRTVDLATLYSDVQREFFEPGHGTNAEVIVDSSNIDHPERWWQHAYARVTVRIGMPEWVEPWVIFGSLLWGVPAPGPLPPVAGRGEFAQPDGGSPYFNDGHAVLMRTRISGDTPQGVLPYYRNWDCASRYQLLADPEHLWWKGWKAVYDDPWPPEGIDPSDPKNKRPNLNHDGTQDWEYKRFGQYVKWST